MQQVKVAVGLGANLGDRLTTIKAAVEALRDDMLLGPKLSSIYESPPWGVADQPNFLNAVIVGASEWKPPAIFNYLKDLERRLGRLPSPVRYGPRAIDLDLLVYGDGVWSEDSLEVPHPRMAERDFVLLPMREVWPEWRHPMLGRTVGELVAALAAKATATVVAPPF